MSQSSGPYVAIAHDSTIARRPVAMSLYEYAEGGFCPGIVGDPVAQEGLLAIPQGYVARPRELAAQHVGPSQGMQIEPPVVVAERVLRPVEVRRNRHLRVGRHLQPPAA